MGSFHNLKSTTLARRVTRPKSAIASSTVTAVSIAIHNKSEFKGVLAGLGALGSVLADLWVRQGWGQWTLIDPDRLMPHNLCRHIAFDTFVGLPKVNIMRDLAVATYPNWKRPHAINSSILEDSAEVTSSLTSAGLIVDVTTTFEVPRELARREDAAWTVSLFVTPPGLSSVMILKDEQRLQRVDGLEGQYYRAILRHDWGHAHLANHLGDRWVGGGCRYFGQTFG